MNAYVVGAGIYDATAKGRGPGPAERRPAITARQKRDTGRRRAGAAMPGGIEGTISQGVRTFGLRCSRYRQLAKTHLQHQATAAATNLERLAAWFRAIPRATTRTSRFAAFAAA
jgi:transposase